MDTVFYLGKAEQCLAGAALSVQHGHYNNAANRAYYAAFQAAIAALVAAGFQPPAPRFWPHDYVLREFCGSLAVVGGVYPVGQGIALKALLDERLKADYETELLEGAAGERALVLAQGLVAAVSHQVGTERECRPSATRRGPARASSR